MSYVKRNFRFIYNSFSRETQAQSRRQTRPLNKRYWTSNANMSKQFDLLQSIDDSQVPETIDFLSMGEILQPKPIASLQTLWSDMFPGMAKSSPTLKKKYGLLLEQARVASSEGGEVLFCMINSQGTETRHSPIERQRTSLLSLLP